MSEFEQRRSSGSGSWLGDSKHLSIPESAIYDSSDEEGAGPMDGATLGQSPVAENFNKSSLPFGDHGGEAGAGDEKRRKSRTWSISQSKNVVKYFRRSSQAAPPLADALNADTAIPHVPTQSLYADHAHSEHHQVSRSNSGFFSRALSDVQDKFESFEERDAEEGADFEFRLAEARGGLPDNVQDPQDIRDVNLEDNEEGKVPVSKLRRGSSTRSPPNTIGFRRGSLAHQSQSAQDVTKREEDNEEKYLVTFESTNCVDENPRTWTYRYRVGVLVVYALFSLVATYTSSMAAPASPVIAKEMHFHSKLEQNLITGVYMLAFAIGPLCSAPLSETFGRRIVVFTCSTLLIIFNIGCAVSQTQAQILVLRFFSGLFGGAMLVMGGGVVSDLFEVHERGQAMALYTASPVLGPTFGPIVSGWIIQGWGPEKWRWVFWVGTFLAAAIFLLGIVFARETYAPRILYLKARRIRKETGNDNYCTVFEKKVETIWQKVKRILLRPVVFILTEPLVTLPAVYMAIIYACFYLCIVSMPRVFGTTYGYKTGTASLHNIAMAIGLLGFGQFGGWFIDYAYKKLSEKHGRRRPEYKLPLMMISVFLLPSGMLLFGWTAEYGKFWIAPDIGLVIVGAGIIGSMLLTQMYLADLMSIYAASAISAVASARSLLAFIFLLFSEAMFDRLGTGWTLSVLALIVGVIGIPAPFLLYKFGPPLRARSKYCVKG